MGHLIQTNHSNKRYAIIVNATNITRDGDAPVELQELLIAHGCYSQAPLSTDGEGHYLLALPDSRWYQFTSRYEEARNA